MREDERKEEGRGENSFKPTFALKVVQSIPSFMSPIYLRWTGDINWTTAIVCLSLLPFISLLCSFPFASSSLG